MLKAIEENKEFWQIIGNYQKEKEYVEQKCSNQT